jgi:segregation and condensation protein B
MISEESPIAVQPGRLNQATQEEQGQQEGADAPDQQMEPDAPGESTAARLEPSTLSLRSLSLPARLEAILYLKGRPVPLTELAEIAAIDRQEAELALITLMTDYAHRDTALEIRQEGQSFSLQLRDDLGDLVQTLIPVDLSTATLRTLATIALKQRILQSDLVELRGSGAYDHIKELLAQDFIERRRQSDGRSFWLSLSEKFHRTFAVQGLEPRFAAQPPAALQLELEAGSAPEAA